MNKLLFPAFFILAGISACKSDTKKDAPKVPESNDLPTMSITKLNGTSVSAKDLTGKTILILFFPDCDHCQREAQSIQEHLSSFSEYNVYFISTASASEISKFSTDYNLSGKLHIHFGTTTVDDVLTNFGPVDAPSLYIYSAEGRLMKSFNGETAIEEIVKSL